MMSEKELLFENLNDIIFGQNGIGWTLSKSIDMKNIELESCSPAGESLIIEISLNGDESATEMVKAIVKAINDEYQYFDVDQHVELWLNQRGKNGVPEHIADLVEDAEAIEEMLKDLADYINEYDLHDLWYE